MVGGDGRAMMENTGCLRMQAVVGLMALSRVGVQTPCRELSLSMDEDNLQHTGHKKGGVM